MCFFRSVLRALSLSRKSQTNLIGQILKTFVSRKCDVSASVDNAGKKGFRQEKSLWNFFCLKTALWAFNQPIHWLNRLRNRLTKIREAPFNKNIFHLKCAFIRITSVDFWEIWFEKQAEWFWKLNYRIRMLTVSLINGQGKVLTQTARVNQRLPRTDAHRREQVTASSYSGSGSRPLR